MPIPPKIAFIKFTLVVILTVSETMCVKRKNSFNQKNYSSSQQKLSSTFPHGHFYKKINLISKTREKYLYRKEFSTIIDTHYTPIKTCL